MQPEGTFMVSAKELSPTDAVRGQLVQSLGSQVYQQWFHDRTHWELHDAELTVWVQNAFLQRWLKKQFRAPLAAAAEVVLGNPVTVRFEVAAAGEAAPVSGIAPSHEVSQVAGIPFSGSSPAPALRCPLVPSLARIQAPPSNGAGINSAVVRPVVDPVLAATVAFPAEGAAMLEVAAAVVTPVAPVASATPAGTRTEPVRLEAPDYTPSGRRRFADLSEFVVGSCNEMAMSAAQRVCQRLGAQDGALFICGPVGTGKTHLLEGLYRQIRRQQPAIQVLYLTAENFTNYFTEALRNHTLPAFRQKFRNVGVLIVDDVDFLEGKRVVQEEFLHTYKQLTSLGRQVIVASDRHPRLISKLSEELITRFLSGVVCRLEAPDAVTREAIALRKAGKMNLECTPEALKYVAQRFTRNVRELEGALNCLQTWQSMTSKRVGITAARQVLGDLERDCTKVIRLPDVERVVCSTFGIEPADLRSSRRTKSLTQPRMLAMYLARKLTAAAYAEIGEFFGGRNHSTVISAERKIDEWLQGAEPIRVSAQQLSMGELLASLEQQLQAG